MQRNCQRASAAEVKPFTRAQLAEALAKSGHGVRLVNSSEELESELQSGDYDVVIAS